MYIAIPTTAMPIKATTMYSVGEVQGEQYVIIDNYKRIIQITRHKVKHKNRTITRENNASCPDILTNLLPSCWTYMMWSPSSGVW